MDTQHIKTSECSIGDIIADDIVNIYGVKLIAKDTVMNDYIREKLLEFGIEDIRVYKQQETKISKCQGSKDRERIVASVGSVKQIFNDLASGKELDYTKIAYVSDIMYSTINKNVPITEYINEIKRTDEYTYTHCINTAFYSMMLSKWMKLPEEDIKKVVQAGLLHDLGKVRVPVEILKKNGYLTKAEYQEIKKHSQYGYEIINAAADIDEEIKKAVLMHHERMDGSGYPFGANRDSLNVYTRIVAITDVFDAMTSDRVYRKKVSPFNVFELFMTTGDSIFDVSMLKIFINNLSLYYVGSKVELDNGEFGEIVYVPTYDITNPIIRVNDSSSLICGKSKILSVL